jgi:glutathione reductase (NADPH)
VRLATGEEFTAKHILVATGGRPFVPEFPGRTWPSPRTRCSTWPALPKRALVVGGGYIASEFACILNGLGVKVSQYYRGAQILRGFDDEARGHVANAMRARGIDIHLRHRRSCGWNRRHRHPRRGDRRHGTRVRPGALRHRPAPEHRRPGAGGAGRWSWAAAARSGRCLQPDRRALGLAVGDVTGRINLTPVAIREGHAFADTVFGAKPTAFDHELVASAVFTQPELGSVGLSEEAARAQEPIEVYATSFRPMKTLSPENRTGC